jgi:hypothetical protein
MTDTNNRTTDLRQQPGVCPECKGLTASKPGQRYFCEACNGTGQQLSAIDKYNADLGRALRAAGAGLQPTPTEVMADVAKRQLVHRICNAYESGVGRGLSGRDLAQPYEPTCGEGIAYENGWYEGCRRHMQSVTISTLESALAKLREPTLWAPVTTGTPVHVLAPDEAAALLQRLEAADSIPDGHLAAIAREAGLTEQQFASLFYNDGPHEITTPTAALRRFVSAILAYRTGDAR